MPGCTQSVVSISPGHISSKGKAALHWWPGTFKGGCSPIPQNLLGNREAVTQTTCVTTKQARLPASLTFGVIFRYTVLPAVRAEYNAAAVHKPVRILRSSRKAHNHRVAGT